MEGLPFIPDTLYGNLVMWPLLVTCGIAALSLKTRRYALFLISYWVFVRFLVSTPELQEHRAILSVIIHSVFFVGAWSISAKNLPGRLFILLSLLLFTTAAGRYAGYVSNDDAGFVFDVWILLQILTIFLWAGHLGMGAFVRNRNIRSGRSFGRVSAVPRRAHAAKRSKSSS